MQISLVADMVAAKAKAHTKIDTAAELKRNALMPPGAVAELAQSFHEASAYPLGSTIPPGPWVQAEINAHTAAAHTITVAQAVAKITSRYSQWATQAAHISTAAWTAKLKVESAQCDRDIVNTLNSLVWP